MHHEPFLKPLKKRTGSTSLPAGAPITSNLTISTLPQSHLTVIQTYLCAARPYALQRTPHGWSASNKWKATEKENCAAAGMPQ